MNEFMTSIFGANWRTALAGYAEALFLVIVEYFHDGGLMPTSTEGWVLWGAAIFRMWFGTVAKDARVSNAPKPADPKPVPDAGKA